MGLQKRDPQLYCHENSNVRNLRQKLRIYPEFCEGLIHGTLEKLNVSALYNVASFNKVTYKPSTELLKQEAHAYDSPLLVLYERQQQ